MVDLSRSIRNLLFSFIQMLAPMHVEGAHFASDSTEFKLFYQAFSSMEIDLDSNAKELLAILYGLKSFKSLTSGKTVYIFMDNRNASIIIARGSNYLRLHCWH